jgi:very-short-patch-repair endonuclease
MKAADTLTPTLSRSREREQEREASVSDSLGGSREKAQEAPASDSLSRERERAGVRVRSRALRQGQTDAEALLWSKLRGRQLKDLKFRRQHPIGTYFADFACIEIGLVIELDGGQHAEDEAQGYDQKRGSDMAALGFQTLRFWNNDVLSNTEAVLAKILQTAETLTPAHSRKRAREQENSKGTS